MAVAEAMLERDAPLPARRARGRAGERRAIAPQRAGNCDRTVAGQPGGPVGIADAERLPEEQRAEARAVDEEIALHPRAVFERDAGDEAGFAVLLDRDDTAFGAGHPLPLGAAAQVARVAASVELKGIAELRQRRSEEHTSELQSQMRHSYAVFFLKKKQ